MGSATREALASSVATLASVVGTNDLATGEQLLESGRIIGDSAQLRAALADHSSQEVNKRGIIAALFGSFTPGARDILGTVVEQRWSSENDLLAGIEELGIRAVAASAPAGLSIESELFSFERAVNSNSELELAVGSKLGSGASKVALVEALLGGGKASAQTVAIVRQLVQQPRDRRIGELLRFATTVVADQAGYSIATVTTATPLAPAQLERLIQGLTSQYGRSLRVNQVIDQSIIGGLRVQIGDDVIDGTVATKLNDLRLQLAR
jgi:F-type H+-transporting ATPase subunit delta